MYNKIIYIILEYILYTLINTKKKNAVWNDTTND